MLQKKNYVFWFCTGSQDLYGEECLAKVAEHSHKIVDALNASGLLPYEVVWKPTLITNELIRRTFNEANLDENCAGVITWMHTFSPAKSWILGLQEYRKPLLHFHTQFNEEIPYDSIDMDFMNENQSAHGDREYGHIVSRMRIERKVVVGHWSDPVVVGRIASFMRTAVGIVESSHIRVMRVADNMRNVAVTEGDKVEAQIKFGWEVDAYPVNEIAESVDAVSASDVNALVDEYYEKYKVRRYGFHGTSHSFVSKRTAEFLGMDLKNSKIIVAHLGNGASISAVLNGECVDTSMGLTPLEGLVMGTRSGDIDPAIMEFIAKKENLDIEGIMNVLNKKSGVQGMSGLSSDFRDLQAGHEAGNELATNAIEVFSYRVAKYIGSYVAAMNGVDAIAFTAGIGENVNLVREKVMSYLGYLGVTVNQAVNDATHGDEAIISTADSKVKVCVIPTNEELAIARETVALVK